MYIRQLAICVVATVNVSSATLPVYYAVSTPPTPCPSSPPPSAPVLVPLLLLVGGWVGGWVTHYCIIYGMGGGEGVTY